MKPRTVKRRKPAGERRESKFSVAFTAEEFVGIEAAAEAEMLPPAVFIRRAALMATRRETPQRNEERREEREQS